MKASDNCIALIKRFEGYLNKPYLCPAGIPTIGFGTTVYPSGKKVLLSDPPITMTEACFFLKNDLIRFESAINKAVTVPITQHQFDALCSFVYNVGVGAFMDSTLLKKINAGEYAGDEFLRWNKAGGKVLAGLTERRQAEKVLFDLK